LKRFKGRRQGSKHKANIKKRDKRSGMVKKNKMQCNERGGRESGGGKKGDLMTPKIGFKRSVDTAAQSGTRRGETFEKRKGPQPDRGPGKTARRKRMMGTNKTKQRPSRGFIKTKTALKPKWGATR